jgi:hypothetical protein
MLGAMNGRQWTPFDGCKSTWFFFGLLTPFTLTSKEATDSAAQFNCSVSIAPPSCDNSTWTPLSGGTTDTLLKVRRQPAPRTIKASLFIQVFAASAILFVATSGSAADFSRYPEPLRSKRDITRASAKTDNIWIAKLPVEDYPALAKFSNLKRVHFHTQEGMGADDEKLLALSRAGLTNLFDVDLLNCPRVTDCGIEYLAQLPALRYLQLEGTSIGDTGCKILATKRSVTGVNVAHCTNVTLKGIIELAHSDRLDELSFSFRGLTLENVLQVISNLRHAKWCEIVDPAGEIDAEVVKRAGNARGVKIALHPQGALRTYLGEKPRPWTSKAQK